ncbi:membrane-associated protein, putative [Bodo saltans]|uniref:Membrane-associated protein, putative n=1 Tax=Bodo saltans TaxID=75058 RepID=A0A0S4IS59_BODSA|nr:membrane-associated protein, putative [Bodo saltans]|eukprot:CUF57453.1 membrane-associated protein, putative [Bodo saltans]
MKLRRPQVRSKFVRLSLILIALVFILNVVYNYSSRGLSAGSGKGSYYQYYFRAKKPKEIKTRDEIEMAAFEAEVADTPKTLPKAENVRLIKEGGGGVEGGMMMMRAEGPEDPVDTAMLLELSPRLVGGNENAGGGGGDDATPLIDLNPMEKSIQKTRYSKEDDSNDPSAATSSTIQHIRNAVNLSTLLPITDAGAATVSEDTRIDYRQQALRIQQKYRFVLIVLAMRTKKHLDIYPSVLEWQHQCDSFEDSSQQQQQPQQPQQATEAPPFRRRGEEEHEGGGGDAAANRATPSTTFPGERPKVVCLFALVFSSDFTNRSVAHYASLFDDDDSIFVVHSNSVMSRDGLSKLHEHGFESGVAHFSKLLNNNSNTAGVAALVMQIDYALLTTVQFTPVARRSSPPSLFVGDLVKQFEDVSDVIDGPEFSRRVPGGSAQRGPILGCTTVMDEMFHPNGPAADYQGARFVMDHGVNFLFGNGGDGVMLNSMHAVRRHAGLLTSDERMFQAMVPPAAAPSFVVTSATNANSSMLPAGVENVHAVSPFCAMMSLRVYRMLLDQHKKSGGDGQWDSPSSSSVVIPAASQESSGSPPAVVVAPTMQQQQQQQRQQQQQQQTTTTTTVHSMIEEFEDLVSTGNHKSIGKLRPDIGDIIKLDPAFKPYVLGTDTKTSRTQLLDIALLRIMRLDTVRSNLHFADVLKGSHRYKTTIPFFIRYVDECVRFYNDIAPKPFYETPRDRAAILERLPKRFRALEAGLEANLKLYYNDTTSKEDSMVASMVFATRVLDALYRQTQPERAKQQLNLNTQVPEESLFWRLCLLARKFNVPSLISNMAVRLQQHQYMEGAILTRAAAHLLPTSPSPSKNIIKSDEVNNDAKQHPHEEERLLMMSPIFQVYAKGAIMQVSSRLGGAHKRQWEVALRDSRIHPSLHQRPRLQVVWYTHCCHCCGFTNELKKKNPPQLTPAPEATSRVVHPLLPLLWFHQRTTVPCVPPPALRQRASYGRTRVLLR